MESRRTGRCGWFNLGPFGPKIDNRRPQFWDLLAIDELGKDGGVGHGSIATSGGFAGAFFAAIVEKNIVEHHDSLWCPGGLHLLGNVLEETANDVAVITRLAVDPKVHHGRSTRRHINSCRHCPHPSLRTGIVKRTLHQHP